MNTRVARDLQRKIVVVPGLARKTTARIVYVSQDRRCVVVSVDTATKRTRLIWCYGEDDSVRRPFVEITLGRKPETLKAGKLKRPTEVYVYLPYQPGLRWTVVCDPYRYGCLMIAAAL